MSEPKTRLTRKSVEAFVRRVPEEGRRACRTLLQILRQIPKSERVMWGVSIVGFGSSPYRYASGGELDRPLLGFSPRNQNLTVDLETCLDGAGDLLRALGRHLPSQACLYQRSPEDVHLPTPGMLLRASVRQMRRPAG